MEHWKNINGYENLYQISDKGRVKSCERIITLFSRNNIPFNKHYKEKIINGGIHKNGYCYVILIKDGKTTSKYIHRLVAEAFVENTNNYQEINHIDENKQNNSSSNLEWCDRKSNMNAGTVQERKGKSKKAFHKEKKMR